MRRWCAGSKTVLEPVFRARAKLRVSLRTDLSAVAEASEELTTTASVAHAWFTNHICRDEQLRQLSLRMIAAQIELAGFDERDGKLGGLQRAEARRVAAFRRHVKGI